MQVIMTHPLGDSQSKALIPATDPVTVGTFGGRIHVEWNPHLELNDTKTRIVDARQKRFNFLSFSIRGEQGIEVGQKYPHVCPAPKSLAKIKDRITQLTAREHTPIPLEVIVRSMNASLRGWSGCFHYRNSKWCTGKGEDAC